MIVRPPWFYGPWQPERQTRFFSMVAARAVPRPWRRKPAAVDGLRRQPGPGGRSGRAAPGCARPGVLGRRPRRLPAAARWWPRYAGCSPRRGIAPRDGQVRVPRRWSAAVAELADRRAPGPRPLLAPGPRARRAGQDHPLRHLERPSRCSATTRRSASLEGMRRVRSVVRAPGLRHRPRRPAARRGAVSADRPWSPAAAATSGRCWSTTCSTPATEVRVLDLIDAADRPADVELVAGRHPRRRPRWRGPSRGIDVVFHNVAQVPLARDRTCSSRSTSAAPRCCSRRASAPGRQGRAHLVVRGLRRAGRQPGDPGHRARARGALRPRQARRRAALPGGDLPRSRRLGRPAAHDPGSRAARHLRDPLRLDRRRGRRAGARVAATTSTSSCTPPTWPTRAAGRPSGPGPPSTTSAPSGSARCGEASRRCASTPARVRGCAACPAGPTSAAMRVSALLGLSPFAPVPLDHVRPVDVVRRRRGHATSWGGGHAGPTRRCCATPTTGSCRTGDDGARGRISPSALGEAGAGAARQAAALTALLSRASRPRRRP